MFIHQLCQAGRVFMAFPSLTLTALLTLSFGLLDLSAKNQDSPGGLTFDVIPPSPEVSGMIQSGLYPVNNFTGLPEITVPLVELNARDYALPIFLQYHPSGIRVDMVASRVGLGWSLQGGGAISREIRGLPDETPIYGYFDFINDQRVSLPLNASDAEEYNLLQELAYGNYDGQPDVFSFSVPGYSGQFYMDSHKRVHMMPASDIVVVPPSNFPEGDWAIHTQDGISFYFNAENCEETLNMNLTGEGQGEWFHKVSWQLSKIVTLKGDEILFSYEPMEIRYDIQTYQYDYVIKPNIWCGQKFGGTGGSQLTMRTQVINKIEGPESIIMFNKGDPRDDLDGGYLLSGINFSYKKSDVEKVLLFHQSYVQARGNHHCKERDASHEKRLLLDSVSFGTHALPTARDYAYKFQYNRNQLPPRCSYSIDHWGYFNGKSNPNLLPAYPGMPGGVVSGDREVDPVSSGALSLEKVILPTGGYIQLDMESNSYLKDMPVLLPLENSVNIIDAGIGDEVNTVIDVNYEQDIFIDYRVSSGVEERFYIEFQLINRETNHLYSQFALSDGNYSAIEKVPPGSYTFKAINHDFAGTDIDAAVTYFRFAGYQNKILYAGGLRVRQLTNHGGAANPPVSRIYEYEEPVIFQDRSDDQYFTPIKEARLRAGDGCLNGLYETCQYTLRSAINRYVFGGPIIGYKKVREYIDPGRGYGYTEYNYMGEPDIGGGGFPFPPTETREWHRGLLKSKILFNNRDVPVQSTTYYYSFVNRHTLIGEKAGFWFDHPCNRGWLYGNGSPDDIATATFRMKSEWVRLDSTVVIDFAYDGPAADSLVTRSEYYYDNAPIHLNVSRTATDIGNDAQLCTVNLYPRDYAKGTDFIDSMKQAHNNFPVEQVNFKKGPNRETVTSGTLVRYASNKLPEEISTLKIASPLPLSEFRFSNSETGIMPFIGARRSFTPDSHYMVDRTIAYQDGNIQSHQARDGILQSYQWDTEELYPIAVAMAAGHADFFFTNFEDIGEFHENARSGERIYAGPEFIMDPSGFGNDLPMKMTYWYLSGGQWTFSGELDFTSVIKIPGEGIDDLRVYPEGTPMTTFSIKPGYGITTITDPANRVTYYEYYPSGVLKSIRNYKKEVLKLYQYHYVSEIKE